MIQELFYMKQVIIKMYYIFYISVVIQKRIHINVELHYHWSPVKLNISI